MNKGLPRGFSWWVYSFIMTLLVIVVFPFYWMT